MAVRNVRRHAKERWRSLSASGEISEDDLVRAEKELQKLTDRFVAEIDRDPGPQGAGADGGLVADDERDGGDDLFEDLDKFFAPIKDVDWDEPATQRGARDPSEEHVAVRTEPERRVAAPRGRRGRRRRGETPPTTTTTTTRPWYDTGVARARSTRRSRSSAGARDRRPGRRRRPSPSTNPTTWTEPTTTRRSVSGASRPRPTMAVGGRGRGRSSGRSAGGAGGRRRPFRGARWPMKGPIARPSASTQIDGRRRGRWTACVGADLTGTTRTRSVTSCRDRRGHVRAAHGGRRRRGPRRPQLAGAGGRRGRSRHRPPRSDAASATSPRRS